MNLPEKYKKPFSNKPFPFLNGLGDYIPSSHHSQYIPSIKSQPIFICDNPLHPPNPRSRRRSTSSSP